MSVTESPAATKGVRANPAPSLILAVALAGVSVFCVVARSWTEGAQIAYIVAGIAALGSYACLTRWIQRVDRTGSRFLQFLERVRCYVAHEDPAETVIQG